MNGLSEDSYLERCSSFHLKPFLDESCLTPVRESDEELESSDLAPINVGFLLGEEDPCPDCDSGDIFQMVSKWVAYIIYIYVPQLSKKLSRVYIEIDELLVVFSKNDERTRMWKKVLEVA